MERRFLKWTIIIVIFFLGLSMGVSHQQDNRNKLQDELRDFEDDITSPNNDLDPVNPHNGEDTNKGTVQIENNGFTAVARDGEYLLKRGLDLILEKGDDLFNLILGGK